MTPKLDKKLHQIQRKYFSSSNQVDRAQMFFVLVTQRALEYFYFIKKL